MNRNMQALGVTVLLLCCVAGCAQDDQARTLIAPTPLYNHGKTDEDVIGVMGTSPGEVLKKQGRIDVSATVEMPDKTPIDVWVIKARDAQGKVVPASVGTVLIVHSYMYGRVDWPFLGIGEKLAKMGYDVVLPNLRRHGHSGGEAITFGVKEKDDLKHVMDQFIGEKVVSSRVYVFGAGFGACVGIQYASIDPHVKGVVAAAPYKDFRSYARQQYQLLPDADFQKVLEAAERLGGFKVDDASAVEAAKKLTCPLLVIHGTFDFTVPAEWSQAILEAAKGPKKLSVVGLEVPLVGAVYEDWLTGQIVSLIKSGLPDTAPPAATRPAGN
jgi:pimeloyl-ACP methyl ester carboxylesterase